MERFMCGFRLVSMIERLAWCGFPCRNTPSDHDENIILFDCLGRRRNPIPDYHRENDSTCVNNRNFSPPIPLVAFFFIGSSHDTQFAMEKRERMIYGMAWRQ